MTYPQKKRLIAEIHFAAGNPSATQKALDDVASQSNVHELASIIAEAYTEDTYGRRNGIRTIRAIARKSLNSATGSQVITTALAAAECVRRLR